MSPINSRLRIRIQGPAAVGFSDVIGTADGLLFAAIIDIVAQSSTITVGVDREGLFFACV